MCYERKTHFKRIRLTLVEGTVFIRAGIKKKNVGKFERLPTGGPYPQRETSGGTSVGF
jgi:hypothetical protein